MHARECALAGSCTAGNDVILNNRDVAVETIKRRRMIPGWLWWLAGNWTRHCCNKITIGTRRIIWSRTRDWLKIHMWADGRSLPLAPLHFHTKLLVLPPVWWLSWERVIVKYIFFAVIHKKQNCEAFKQCGFINQRSAFTVCAQGYKYNYLKKNKMKM